MPSGIETNISLPEESQTTGKAVSDKVPVNKIETDKRHFCSA